MADYNGWSNWHTWNANLYLNNDEVTYKNCRHACLSRTKETALGLLKYYARNVVPKTEGINFDMVNWEEIFNSFNAE